MTPPFRHVVVIGASTGGVRALLDIAAALPPRFAAPVCIVQHVGRQPSILPELLRARGPNPAVHARDGQPLVAGTLHVAPPDHHLLVEGSVLRLTRGPKENHARPAIDPLFFSAAVSWGARTVGVVLTGQMDDGAAGLRAIKDSGGVAVVQDPDSAEEADMPRNALAATAADHCVPLRAIAPLLAQLVQRPPGRGAPASERVRREAAIQQGDRSMENLSAIAEPSPLTCPECQGALFELRQEPPLRYRCHLGHAYGAGSLLQAQAARAEDAMWSSIRALRERQMLLQRFGGILQNAGDAAQAAAARAEADRLQQQIAQLVRMSRGADPPVPDAAHNGRATKMQE